MLERLNAVLHTAGALGLQAKQAIVVRAVISEADIRSKLVAEQSDYSANGYVSPGVRRAEP